jgi:succinate-acetate transporter protein
MSPVERFKQWEHSGRIWRWLVNFWTIIFFIVAIDEFWNHNPHSHVMGPVAAIYVACLAIYSAEKEFERWQFYFMGRHPGELYVIAWTALAFGMLLVSFATGGAFEMAPEVFSTYIVVLGILAITRKSKLIFSERHKEAGELQEG